MIIYDNGKDEPRMVMHCSCTKKMTEQEAKEHLDHFLKLRQSAFDKILDEQNDMLARS